jgi:hypothetical protein
MNLLKLLDRPITFHRCFVDITGSISAALLLSQAVYWTNKLPPEREGWFHKSREEWLIEIGLDRRELDTARRVLESLEVLETRRAKLPNAGSVTGLWHRVNPDALARCLEAATNGTKRTFANGTDRTDQRYESAFCSPIKEKNNNYTSSTTTTRAREFLMDLDWVPNEAAFEKLQDSGIPVEFICMSLHEFRAYWLSRGEKKPDWNPEFIRQTRHQFAYQHQQEQRRHDRSETRSRVSGLPTQQSGRQRRETVTERNARYERFAAGLDTGNDAEFAAENAITADFTRH